MARPPNPFALVGAVAGVDAVGVAEVVDTLDAVARVLYGARAPPRPPPPGQLMLLH